MIVNLRHPDPPIQFSCDNDRERYHNEVVTALEAQPTRYAVAPRCSVGLPGGRVLKAGEPVTRDLFEGGDEPGWRLFEHALRSGRVLEAPDKPETPPEDDGPEAA